MSENKDIGEEALSKVAELGIKSQLDQVQNLAVEIDTNPIKVMQGELDGIEIEGEGLVTKEHLRTEELTVKTERISINPFKATLGEIELEKTANAQTRVVLTQKDIETAFNSEFIQDKLQNLKVEIDGKPTTIQVNNVCFTIPGNSKIDLSAEVYLVDSKETKEIAFSTMLAKSDDGYSILLNEVEYAEGEEISSDLTKALLESVKELLDLRNFALEGMSLRLQDLQVETGKLILQALTEVEKLSMSA